MAQGMIYTYKYSQFAFLDINNYPAGIDTTPNTVSTPAVSNAYLYDKPVDIPGLALTYGAVQGLGGGIIWTQRITGLTGIADVTMSMSALDETLEGFWSNTTPDTTTVSGVTAMTRNAAGTVFPPMMSLHTFMYSEDGSTDVKYLTKVYLNVQHKNSAGEGSSQGDGTNPNVINRDFTTNYNTRTAWGELFSAATLNVERNQDLEMWVKSDHPMALATYWDDGIATSFVVGRKLFSSTVADNFIFKNGVDNSSAVSAIAPTTGTFTVTAGTANDIWTILYQTQNDMEAV